MNQTQKSKQRHCKMIECGHYKQGGCQPCEECGSKSYIVDPTCRRCFDCENKEGELRWGDKHKQELEMLSDIIKLVNLRVEEIKQEREQNNKQKEEMIQIER